MVDGTWDDAAAYERLQRIAGEEGLRTLGTRDPGHLELPRAAADALREATIESMDAAPLPARASSPSAVADVARVAQPAAVAAVATVAPVAAVAQPGVGAASPSAARRSALRGAEGRAAESAQAIADQAHRSLEVAARATRRRGAGGGERESAREHAHDHVHDALREGRGAGASAAHAHAVAPAGAPEGAPRADASGRIARVLELQDGAAARPLSHITLRLDNEAGGVDRIRVDLRGTGVDARIDVGDGARAESLGARLGELRDALGRHGLQADSVRIGAGGRGAEAEAGRLAVASGAAAGAERSGDASASSQQQRDAHRDAQRDTARDQPREQDRDQPRGRAPRDREGDDARHRSRREPRHGDRS
jgi:hypothetical protein